MKVLGITGQAGSGKSEILEFLQEEYGAAVCQMDQVARNLQRRGTDCFIKIVQQFGNEIVGEDGELDRAVLARIVFQDALSLRKLNDIVHPGVLAWVKSDMEQKKRKGEALYVVESALLPDVGYDLCDEIWYIRVSEDVRRERLKASRGYTDERVTAMIESQPGEDVYLAVSSAVIDNSGTLENTKRQIGDRL